MAGSSASSSGSSSFKYDVFLSFRGEDTRTTFTSHLNAALRMKKINAFIDEENLRRGEEISHTLLRAIEESKLSTIVFSKNYASSRWCLDEIAHIMKCREERGQTVLPVFYGVDPSDVRHQKGSYADAFAKHEERYKDTPNKVQEWRNALTAAANISGFSQDESVSEAKLVERIVNAIEETLYSISQVSSDDFEDLVGMDKHFEKLETLLHVGSPDVRVIGIWGMAGMGKTTLAKTLFKRIDSHFEGSYFATVKGESNEDELHQLKEDMFSILLNNKNLNNVRSSFVNDMLCRKKTLVVLDNVNQLKQIECLLGDDRVSIGASQQKKSRFGVGSRIILTSRDKKLLKARADVIYEVKALDSDEALKLFYWKAFEGDSPPTNYEELSRRVVHYAQGNPLALDVLGSHLRSRTTREWESTLIELQKIPNDKIHQVLKISYDALDQGKKTIFLDIACFLMGEDRDFAEGILGLESHIGINMLIEKSLITIKDRKLLIHDLLQQMAFEIIRQESKEVGQRSRLHNAQDACHVLKNNKGNGAIEGIYLDLCKIHEDICLRSNVFEDMCNLRFLVIFESYTRNSKSIHIPQDLSFLPCSLRYLRWSHCPLKSLPSNFEPENLVILDMHRSNLKELWNGVKYLRSLEKINLSYSEELIKLPDLSRAPKLVNMNLSGCISLHHIPNLSDSIRYLDLSYSGIKALPSSVGSLENLVSLDLKFCEHLKNLPSEIWKLKSLQRLNLSNCSRLKILPAIYEVMEHLQDLSLDRTRIEELPSSIENLIGLRHLDLAFCENLKFVPESLNTLSHLSKINLEGCSKLGCFPMVFPCLNLTELDFSYCNIQKVPDWLGSLSSLRKIHLRGNNFERLPSSIRQLDKLDSLHVSRCKNLRHLPKLPLSTRIIEASECTSLETVDISKDFRELPSGSLEEVGFLFYNCRKMEQSARENVVICFLSKVYNHIGITKFSTRDSRKEIKACYPGKEMPKWFSKQWEGSKATIKLPPNCLDNEFSGFATYVALEFDVPFDSKNLLEIFTDLRFKTNNGETKYASTVSFANGNIEDWKESIIVSSDHVFIWYQNYSDIKFDLWNLDAEEASFEFSIACSTHNLVKVRRCGIRVMRGEEAGEEWAVSQEDLTFAEGICQDVITKRRDCSSNSYSEGHSSGYLIAEMPKEPAVITNQAEPSGTKTTNTDAKESGMTPQPLRNTSRVDLKAAKANLPSRRNNLYNITVRESTTLGEVYIQSQPPPCQSTIRPTTTSQRSCPSSHHGKRKALEAPFEPYSRNEWVLAGAKEFSSKRSCPHNQLPMDCSVAISPTNYSENEMFEKGEEGMLLEIHTEDLFTEARGTIEHSGQVWAQSCGVTNRDYFLKPARGLRQLQEEQFISPCDSGIGFIKQFRKSEQTYEECYKAQEERFQDQQQSFADKMSQQFSTKMKAQEERLKGSQPPAMLSQLVEASIHEKAVESLDANKNEELLEIMANEGAAYGRPLRDDNYLVLIDECYDECAQLPLPVPQNMFLVVQAVGNFVAWPKHLVFIGDYEARTKKLKKKSILPPLEPQTQKKENPSQRMLTQDIASSSIMPNSRFQFEVASNIPRSLRLLLNSIKYFDPRATIQIGMHEDIFGQAHTMFIVPEDIVQFAHMTEIGAPCISLYIRILHYALENAERSQYFRFIDPSWASIMGSANLDCAHIISKRLKLSKTGQFWLLPYNTRRHWMLIIIDPSHETCFFLDPIGNPPWDEIKYLMSMVFNFYNAGRNTWERDGDVLWKDVECPRQPSNVECGFYILRYMREFCFSDIPIEWLSNKCNEKKIYTKEEIDEVRTEWADALHDLL